MKQEEFDEALFNTKFSKGVSLKNIAVEVGQMYLNETVFNDTFYDEIARQLKKDSLRGFKLETSISNIKEEQFVKLATQFKFAQTDVPSWIVSSEDKPTIMVIAQDALRSKKDKKYFEENSLLINTPFSLQGFDDREIKASYSYLLSQIADLGNVYVTDVYKMFFEADRKIKSEFKKGGKKNINVLFLKEEIDKLKPDLIITMGAPAFNIIQNFTKEKARTGITNNNAVIYTKSNEIPVFGMIHLAAYASDQELFIQANWSDDFLEPLTRIKAITQIVCKKITSTLK